MIKQFQHLFRLEDATLDFTEDALLHLAEKALKRKTGARALRAVLDEYMLDLMYDLPDYEATGVTFLLDTDSFLENTPLSDLAQQRAKESA